MSEISKSRNFVQRVAQGQHTIEMLIKRVMIARESEKTVILFEFKRFQS